MRIYKILLLACTLFAVQACVKIESEIEKEICDYTPSKPELMGEGQTIITPSGSYFTVVLEDTYEYGAEFHLYNPLGYEIIDTYLNDGYKILANSTFQSGRYAMVATRDDGSCTSDTAFITLLVGTSDPQCGMGDNELKMSSSPSTFTTNIPTGIMQGNTYDVQWTSGNTSFAISFGEQPSTTDTEWYEMDNSFFSYLQPSMVRMYMEHNGYIYSQTTGYVTTTPIGNGKIRVKLCNCLMYSGSAGYKYASANMFYQQ